MVCEGCAALASDKGLADIIKKLDDERQAKRASRKRRQKSRPKSVTFPY
jgi:hypothetical protein